MWKVLVVLMCNLLAFNFAAKTWEESESDESDDEKRNEIERNNPERLKPLVLIVKSTNLDAVFFAGPRKNAGVRLDGMKLQDTDVFSNQLRLDERKMYLCPHPTVKDVLGESHRDSKHLHNCLYVTKFDPEKPNKCAEQPKSITLIFSKIPDITQSTRLGKVAVKFCYPVTTKNRTTKCYMKGIRKFFNKPVPVSEVAIKRNHLNLYHFGYNEEEERTEYAIQLVIPMSTPGYFTLQPDENSLARSGRDKLKNSFDSLIKAYKAQDKTKPYWLAHRLAQPTQYPFNIMTMATSKIINTAPLQNKLQPLIYLIEERIQKLSDHISKPLRVTTKPLHYEFDKNVGKLYLDENRRFFIPNIWSKKIYDEDTESGIIIIVHNYPEYVPAEGLLCKKTAACQFQKWKRESSQFKDAFDETLIKFAYCCKEAKFPIMVDADIEEAIDINFDSKN